MSSKFVDALKSIRSVSKKLEAAADALVLSQDENLASMGELLATLSGNLDDAADQVEEDGKGGAEESEVSRTVAKAVSNANLAS